MLTTWLYYLAERFFSTHFYLWFLVVLVVSIFGNFSTIIPWTRFSMSVIFIRSPALGSWTWSYHHSPELWASWPHLFCFIFLYWSLNPYFPNRVLHPWLCFFPLVQRLGYASLHTSPSIYTFLAFFKISISLLSCSSHTAELIVCFTDSSVWLVFLPRS